MERTVKPRSKEQLQLYIKQMEIILAQREEEARLMQSQRTVEQGQPEAKRGEEQEGSLNTNDNDVDESDLVQANPSVEKTDSVWQKLRGDTKKRMETVMKDHSDRSRTERTLIFRSYAAIIGKGSLEATEEGSSEDADPTLNSRATFERFAKLLFILNKCYQTLSNNTTLKLRRLLYSFRIQFPGAGDAECIGLTRQLCQLLGVRRHDLGLRASTRGQYCGDLTVIGIDGEPIPMDESTGLPVLPYWLDDPLRIKLRPSTAWCILVVEKESQFDLIVQYELWKLYNFIVVHGRGYGSYSVRAMVHVASKLLKIPVFALVDCDPHGFSIMSSYVYSEGNTTLDGGYRYTTIPRLCGLFPSQLQRLLEEHGFTCDVLKDLNKREKGMVEKMSNGVGFGRLSDQHKAEAKLLFEWGKKAGLECLSFLKDCHPVEGLMVIFENMWNEGGSIRITNHPGLRLANTEGDAN